MDKKRILDIAEKLGISLPDFACPEVGQTPDEIINTLKIVKKLDPEVILEIGTARGGFIYLLSAMLGDKSKTMISIDPWTKGTKYEASYDIYKDTISGLRQNYPSNNYFHIRGKSADKSSIDALKELLQGRKIDFWFIDGDHSYEGVINDWTNYRIFLDKSSVVAFHDIAEDPGAGKAWKEIIAKNKDYACVEFKRKGVSLLDFENGKNEKYSMPMVLGVGYLFVT